MLVAPFPPRVAAAHLTQRSDALATIVEAFENDPACRALWPEVAGYRRHFPRFIELFGGPAQADRTSDDAGAALWLAPGVGSDPEPLMAHLDATLPAERKAAIFQGLEIQAGLHPHEDHWYLPFIGVRPEAQGRGTGAALLAHGLARVDDDRMPAYLEATSRRSVPLYRSAGFEVIGVVESPGYPEIFAMWRPARERRL
jgi:ribosomal protein S18 acetylase RimI-like enzyme